MVEHQEESVQKRETFMMPVLSKFKPFRRKTSQTLCSPSPFLGKRGLACQAFP